MYDLLMSLLRILSIILFKFRHLKQNEDNVFAKIYNYD